MITKKVTKIGIHITQINSVKNVGMQQKLIRKNTLHFLT